MLYTTTDADGSPAVSSGTILAPDTTDGTTLPLLTVSHGTTGVVDGCAPSLSYAPFADGAGTAMAEMVTEHGWVAVTSDYVGMGTDGTAAYLVGDAEARNVLDASLAAREFDQLEISDETVVWGHSQGGQGSLWTGQLAESYAPSLTVLGIAAFAPAADLYGLADADKNDAAGKTVSAYIAATWNDVFPSLQLESHLTPGSAAPVERISQLCFNGSDVLAAIIRGSQTPNQIFPDTLLEGEFGERLKKQTPTGPFPAPVLVAQGLSDPLVLPRLQQSWVDDRCAAGEVIDYRTFEGLSHVSLVAADSPLTPQIVEWSLDRWNGETAPTACTSKEFPKAE
jgi:alpha-beta hydrolase superfamily lysophospholipase